MDRQLRHRLIVLVAALLTTACHSNELDLPPGSCAFYSVTLDGGLSDAEAEKDQNGHLSPDVCRSVCVDDAGTSVRFGIAACVQMDSGAAENANVGCYTPCP